MTVKALGDMTMILMCQDGGADHHNCRTEYWREGSVGVTPKKVLTQEVSEKPSNQNFRRAI